MKDKNNRVRHPFFPTLRSYNSLRSPTRTSGYLLEAVLIWCQEGKEWSLTYKNIRTGTLTLESLSFPRAFLSGWVERKINSEDRKGLNFWRDGGWWDQGSSMFVETREVLKSQKINTNSSQRDNEMCEVPRFKCNVTHKVTPQ